MPCCVCLLGHVSHVPTSKHNSIGFPDLKSLLASRTINTTSIYFATATLLSYVLLALAVWALAAVLMPQYGLWLNSLAVRLS